MIAFYIEKIKDGTITIDNVSARWRVKGAGSIERVGEKHMEIRARP